MADDKGSKSDKKSDDISPFTQWVTTHGDIIGGVITIAFVIAVVINIF